MDKEEKEEYTSEINQAIHTAMSDPKYWARKRWKWDEWGSPVGLGLAWTLFIIPLGLFLYLLYAAHLIK